MDTSWCVGSGFIVRLKGGNIRVKGKGSAHFPRKNKSSSWTHVLALPLVKVALYRTSGI